MGRTPGHCWCRASSLRGPGRPSRWSAAGSGLRAGWRKRTGRGAALRGRCRAQRCAARRRHENQLGQSANARRPDPLDGATQPGDRTRLGRSDGERRGWLHFPAIAEFAIAAWSAHRHRSAVARACHHRWNPFNERQRHTPYSVWRAARPDYRHDDRAARWHPGFERRQSGKKRRRIRPAETGYGSAGHARRHHSRRLPAAPFAAQSTVVHI